MKKNKFIYMSIIVLIFIAALNILSVKSVKAETSYTNGDLRRCKEEDKNSGKCEEKIVGGKVIETRIKETFDEYTVTKIVRKKTGSADKFDISFIVDGPDATQTQVSRNANIVVLFDKSSSLTGNSNSYENARNAVVDFSKRFQEQKLSLVVFAGNIKTFTGTPFNANSIKNAGVGSSSHIEKAFKKANEIFDNSGDDENNYVIVFGDGQYWFEGNTCRKCDNCRSNECQQGKSNTNCAITFEDELQKLKSRSNINFYAILYKSSSTTISCDYEWIKKIADGENFYDARSNNNYSEFFERIAESIETHQESTTITITALVKDQIGSDFNLTSGNNIINVDKLGVETTSFEVQLKESAKTESDVLWHSTNNGYTVTIQKSDGTNRDLSSSLSPEVYWKPESTELESCSGNINNPKSESSSNDYFTEVCEDIVTGNVIVNNLDLGAKSFSIQSGLGFPAKINLNDTVACTYTFNASKFKEDYMVYHNQLSSSDPKEVADATVSLEDMNSKLNSFYELTTGSRLNVFKDNEFPGQTAKVPD